ncbi:hypothetical protein [Blastomonas sp.]
MTRIAPCPRCDGDAAMTAVRDLRPRWACDEIGLPSADPPASFPQQGETP